jgi:hypothetical protein
MFFSEHLSTLAPIDNYLLELENCKFFQENFDKLQFEK